MFNLMNFSPANKIAFGAVVGGLLGYAIGRSAKSALIGAGIVIAIDAGRSMGASASSNMDKAVDLSQRRRGAK